MGGAEDFPASRRTRRSALRVLRGPAHRQRHAARGPRAHARDEAGIFLRYRSMCGYRVPRRAGWDTHGLPVEVEVEKELGISGRAAIAEYGVEAFSKKCIDSVFRYIKAAEDDETDRLGSISTTPTSPSTSATSSRSGGRSSALRRRPALPGTTRSCGRAQGGTALSMGEVGQGYKEVDDPSVMVRFPIRGADGTSFSPGPPRRTLPSNVALAVKSDATYDGEARRRQPGRSSPRRLSRR
ncbi:MAG: class I tRNA ligase family protein [Polyangiales bacterium]